MICIIRSIIGLLCLSAGIATPAKAADETLLLEVHLNGRPTVKIGEFKLVGGQLRSRRAELRELGLLVSDNSYAQPDDLVPLSALPGVSFRLDTVHQQLFLKVSDKSLLPNLVETGSLTPPMSNVESGTGALLNYDITGTVTGGRAVAAGLLDFRAFSPWGIISSGFLAYARGSFEALDAPSIIRLDTSYTISNPATLRRIRVGDFISGGLSWTRPVRLGGAQFSLEFELRPDLITFPLPLVSGSSAVPSTLDVLVNGTRLFSRDIEAGPFTIPQLPVVNGAGTISTTLTDALGKQVSTTLPFYATSALLDTGLQSFSGQIGFLRQNYGLISNDYRQLAGSATYRRGLSDILTIEVSAEHVNHVSMAGIGGVFNFQNIAIVNAAAATSVGAGRFGNQFSVGVQHIGTVFSISGSIVAASKRYRDLASVNGERPPRLQISVNGGMALGRIGSIGIAYVGIFRDASLVKGVMFDQVDDNGGPRSLLPQNGISYLQPAQRASVASASYSVQLRRTSLFITGFRDFARRGSGGALAGISMAFGSRSSASVNSGWSKDGATFQGQASQSAVAVGDWGYQIVASPSHPEHEYGEVSYRAPFSLLSAGLDRSHRETTVRVEAQGSVVLIADSLFASNTIHDSFAVVDTNGLAGVHVRSENRDVGVTDRKGRLLVPELRSFDINHLSIEPTDIPLDIILENSMRSVRPQDRSGVIVRFAGEPHHAALLRIVDKAGVPVQMGSSARLVGHDPVPVGYDGEAYLSGMTAQNQILVERPDGRRCAVSINFTPVAGEIPVLGPLTCTEQVQ